MLARSQTLSVCALLVAGLVFAPQLAGCAAEAPAEDVGDTEEALGHKVKTPAEWDRDVTRPATDLVAARSRQHCEFKRGSLPGETLAPSAKLGAEIPIKTIVVLMMENRSFDSYFGKLAEFTGRRDIDGAPASTSVPEDPTKADSPRVPWQHAPALCSADTPHEWSDMHRDYNNGKMDGFFASSNGHTEGSYSAGTFLSGARAMWYYDQRDIPFYYALASTFAIGDRYFSPVIGPTYPNRDFMYAASSYGETGDAKFDMKGKGFPEHDLFIFDELEKRHTSWAVYKNGFAAGIESALPVREYYTRYGVWKHHQRFKGTDQFFEDARDGKLPEVVFVDPNLLGGTPAAYHLPYDWENDEHPPSNIQKGQELSASVVHALMKSKQWKELALFITWDEAGGMYDHVAPPPACPPDDVEPRLTTGEDREFPGRFDRYGFRVPVLVVSPFAKKAHVSHETYDHTSILRFIEAKHKIPALSNRDANANVMFDMFDFDSPPFMTPPSLPDSYVDPAQHDECKRLYQHVK